MTGFGKFSRLMVPLCIAQLLLFSAFAAEYVDTGICETSSRDTSHTNGSTEQHRDEKRIHRPECSVNARQPMRRVVGYYEGFASTLGYDKYLPLHIPDGVYTQINFAYATVDPTTFEIVPAVDVDIELYEALAEKKQIDPSLKIFIAIRDWAFDEPGRAAPTTTTFSEIAQSLRKQKIFIASVISFMNAYDFDGVDLNWAYPRASDRGGRSEDYENLPKFLANLKAGMEQSGSKHGLSLAIPASHWYLRYFDLKKIAKHVDSFNMRTYDLHGPLNTPLSLLQDRMTSHTNLTDIKDSLDLLWARHVDPQMVNLGLAFHSRTFTAADQECLSAGCRYNSLGEGGHFVSIPGHLSNRDIHSSSRNRRVAVLDEKAAVKIVTKWDDWFTYDDKTTWKLKLDYARSRCLGGVTVWFVSHDTKDGEYSRQLQSVTGYSSNQISESERFVESPYKPSYEGKIEASKDVIQEQCRWTGCGQSCPSYWHAVLLHNDNQHGPKERMLDGTGCRGRGSRAFCCPPGEQPTCEWQHFKMGKCTSRCDRDDQYEVSSSDLGCNNREPQVACCSGDTPSLHAYLQRTWVKSSTDRNNDQACSKLNGDGECSSVPGKLRNNDASTSTVQWTHCPWYQSFSSDITSKGTQGDASCPDGMFKPALQPKDHKPGENQVFCCDAQVTTPEQNPFKDFEVALAAWVKNPTCPIPNRLPASFSAPRMVVIPGLSEIIAESPTSLYTKRLREIWDELILPVWGNLKAKKLSSKFPNESRKTYWPKLR